MRFQRNPSTIICHQSAIKLEFSSEKIHNFSDFKSIIIRSVTVTINKLLDK